MIKETWKEIPGFEGYYEVSDLGRVRSMDREVKCGYGRIRVSIGKILKPGTDVHGRLFVNLSKENKAKPIKIHRLVALAFIGERPTGYQVCHINGNSNDNRLINLKYDTRSENMNDMYRYGGKNGRGKLTIEQVLEIRRLFNTGKYYQKDLAKLFGVTQTQVSSIVLRKSYSYLNDDGTIDESQTAVS